MTCGENLGSLRLNHYRIKPVTNPVTGFDNDFSTVACLAALGRAPVPLADRPICGLTEGDYDSLCFVPLGFDSQGKLFEFV